MISSLLSKCPYTAPGLSPASRQMSCMEVWWNPCRAKPLGEVRPVIDAGGLFNFARESGMIAK